MGGYASGSKTMISQRKMQALVLTTKTLIVSTIAALVSFHRR